MLGTERKINGYALEICSNSSFSALQAQLGGASRVELCQNLENGGTTPSYGQIRSTRKLLDIGIHVLIRPRAGDFVYTAEEFEEIKEDIRFCKEVGCDGVVIGVLHPDGSVDKERCAELVALAKPLTAVFHRAFDRCKDPLTSLETIISLGFDRILTSGLALTAEAGKELLTTLIEKAAGRIEVMPGSGVNEGNIVGLLKETGAQSIHSSAKVTVASTMQYDVLPSMGMNEATMQTSKLLVEELVSRIEQI